jgi:hypothetical protein
MPHEDTDCPYVPNFGHPHFWRTALEAFPRCFEVLGNIVTASNSLSHDTYTTGDPFKRALVQLSALSTQAIAELMILVGNGHGIGALKITRTLLEYAINAVWLKDKPGEQELFLKWHFVEQEKLLRYMRDHQIAIDMEPDRIRRADEEFARVRHLFEDRTGRVRPGWSRTPLRERAAASGLGQAYALLYPQTSKVIHGTIGGLAQQLRLGEDGQRAAFVDPPSLDHCALALRFGHMFALIVLSVQADVCEVDSTPPLNQLQEEYRYAWG